MYAWHFLRQDSEGRPTLRNGELASDVGEWLEHTGHIEICSAGLHASWRAIDALQYLEWDDAVACLVEVDSVVAEEDDKFVCRRRRIVGMCDADQILRLFARECALSVAHLWNPPAIVIQYLQTGDETIRDAARAATGDAARDAAWDAARAAAWYAALDAARDAAWDAALDAQNDMLESMLLAEMEIEF